MNRFLLLFFSLLTVSLAGPGHDHGDEPTTASAADGPVRLTRVMVENLGIQTAEARLQRMEKTFPSLGHVEADPARLVALSSRIAGRVTRLAVHEGQEVKAGDFVLELESRIVADPPPRLVFTAPRDGVVLDLLTAPGDAVSPESRLLSIADLSEIFAVALVPEAWLSSVHAGQKVHVYPLAFPESVFVGEVVRTAASVDRETGTLRVFVRLDNPGRRLLPGMRLRLGFVTEAVDTAVIVPRAAVLGEGGDLFVFRQLLGAPHTYERTPVVVGLRNDRQVEIVSGILPGDLVVTQGNYQLQYVAGDAREPASAADHAHGAHGHKH